MPKNAAILRASARKLRLNGTLLKIEAAGAMGGEAIFQARPTYLELLNMVISNADRERKGEELLRLRDTYLACSEVANRNSKGMQALSMDDFLRDAVQFGSILDELGLIAVL